MAPWGSRSASLSMHDVNICFLESTSDGLTNCHQNQDTPDLICVSGNMASWNESQPSGPELQIKKTIQFLQQVLVLVQVLIVMVMQMLLLVCAGMAAGLSWNWSAVGAGCCVVVSGHLPGRCSEETKGDLGRHFEVSI